MAPRPGQEVVLAVVAEQRVLLLLLALEPYFLTLHPLVKVGTLAEEVEEPLPVSLALVVMAVAVMVEHTIQAVLGRPEQQTQVAVVAMDKMVLAHKPVAQEEQVLSL
jgi:hypothetical protein